MLYSDPITTQDFLALCQERGTCVSLYLPTTPVTQDTQADRINLSNLITAATEQALAIATKTEVAEIEEQLLDLLDDDDFWSHQANGLGILVTPARLVTYRLVYSVESLAEVSDRFHLKPLIPAFQPKTAFVLAISQKSVNLYEFTPNHELITLSVEDLPADFSAVTNRTLQRDAAPSGRLQGGEGKKVLQRQFVRAIDQAMRPVMTGSNVPLILATTSDLQALYRSVSNYSMLVEEAVTGSVENLPMPELTESVKPIVQNLRHQRLESWEQEFQQRSNESRASSDLTTIAKLASRGQVAKLLVDTDSTIYGSLDDNGSLTLAEGRSGESYGVMDEIINRVMLNGGEVLGVRQDDPEVGSLLPISAILRWA